MMIDRVMQRMATIPDVSSQTATFEAMDGTFAVVRIGAEQVRLPYAGVAPPGPGSVVQIEWRAGAGIVTPAVPASPYGKVTAVDGPLVTVAGETLPYLKTFTPTVGMQVAVDWTARVVLGPVSTVPTPPAVPDLPSGGQPFQVVVRATASNRWRTDWWGDDPWSSNRDTGLWVYGDRMRDQLDDAEAVDELAIWLPFVEGTGTVSAVLAAHPTIPSSAPVLEEKSPLLGLDGWQPLPQNWATTLADGTHGIAVTGGDARWKGVRTDAQSGAIRITGYI